MYSQPVTATSASLPPVGEGNQAIASEASIPASVEPTHSVQAGLPSTDQEQTKPKTYSVKPIHLDNRANWSVLHDAVKHNNPEFVEHLVKNYYPMGPFVGDINRIYQEKTALYLAAESGYDSIVEILIEGGAELNKKAGFFQQTPLSSTMSTGSSHPATMKILLDAGCEIEETNAQGQTPLHVASLTHCTASLQLLLEYGANREASDSDNNTPLISCALYYHTPFFDKRGSLELLLDAGVNVEEKSKDGFNAFHTLIQNGAEREDVRLMLKYGADMNAHNQTSVPPPPLYIAMNRLLSSEFSERDREKSEMRFCHLLDLIVFLLNADADLDIKAPLPDKSIGTIRHFLYTGNIQNTLESIISREQFSNRATEKLAQFLDDIEAIENTPLPLLRLTRRFFGFHIRGCSKGHSKAYLNRVKTLPIPNPLKGFIQFQEPVPAAQEASLLSSDSKV